MPQTPPFSDFAPAIRTPSNLRRAITAATRRPEPECLAPLLVAAAQPEARKAAIAATAGDLIGKLRARPKGRGVEALVQEYALSSQEGVALMCLAEALLRIPDSATRDRLIRDKIATGDWRAHLGKGRSLFVNAATWGLVVTGRLTSTVSEQSLGSALTRLIGRAGEPVIRKGVDLAMRMMGEQFVTGETIDEALKRARKLEAEGFRYSYDMLGEAAMTAGDAARYYRDYEEAIHAIGRAAAGRVVYEGPGISIKLSALHPRYSRSQSARVMAELRPRVKALALLAKGYDIGLNIDAEEADRLELSLDLLESLCLDADLAGWQGVGFVVQAYGRRCPFVLDFIIDLARRTGHRIMLRLVKGAYWDSEIKRAQVDGLADFPVFTRKPHTDVSYIACAAKLLAAPDAVFPQFATHNAQTLATIYHLAGPEAWHRGQYEFQCLHGMGEPLYENVVGAAHLDRPCRIYAPVGTHETLLAYLVRRLLENGANSSFVHQISDGSIPTKALIADPVDTVLAEAEAGQPHPALRLPPALFGAERRNSAGLDLASEAVLAGLSGTLAAASARDWVAAPLLASGLEAAGEARPVANPARLEETVGRVIEANPDEAAEAARRAAGSDWPALPAEARAARLEAAADLYEANAPAFLALAIREAGKSAANAVAELREAVDFLRYYAAEARAHLGESRPLGPVACISPWNFPLAIFTGQIAAALAAGNPVLAKPAEETPLIAAEAVRLLHEAGIPADALQLLPGDGRIGAALVSAPEVAAVMFTGSTEVARLINASLATRRLPSGGPVPLIAETGGQNAMIVDSSALAEQVVGDVIASAFDSAGQRCSALRILCLQEDVADHVLKMLRGALAELKLAPTDRLSADIGPVITAEAKAGIEAHVAKLQGAGMKVDRLPLGPETADGHFTAPTIIELDRIERLEREVFGPVLHVIRFHRDRLEPLIEAINATGYGLTFGLHTRIDETIARVSAKVGAGNLYINRNIIGAVVGVQPFGGHGLSGTGPKAGGPLYLGRLVQQAPQLVAPGPAEAQADTLRFADWLEAEGMAEAGAFARELAARSPLGTLRELPGPVGERNLYILRERGRLLLLPQSREGAMRQIAAMLAGGNEGLIAGGLLGKPLPGWLAARVTASADWQKSGPYAGALIEDGPELAAQLQAIAALPGPIVPVQRLAALDLGLLLGEVSISTNTTAAGGNASLMALA